MESKICTISYWLYALIELTGMDDYTVYGSHHAHRLCDITELKRTSCDDLGPTSGPGLIKITGILSQSWFDQFYLVH